MIDRLHILLHLLRCLASCRQPALLKFQPVALEVLIGGFMQPIEVGGVQCEPASQPHGSEPVPLIQEFTHRISALESGVSARQCWGGEVGF